MEIIRQPRGITHELRRMNRYGILAAYLPEFANIVGRMQYYLFHAYTVDAHTLFVVRNLRRFTVPEFKHEFPLCSHIMATLPKPETATVLPSKVSPFVASISFAKYTHPKPVASGLISEPPQFIPLPVKTPVCSLRSFLYIP